MGPRLLADTYLSSSVLWQWWVLRASVASRLIQGFPIPNLLFTVAAISASIKLRGPRRSLVFSLTLYRYVLLMRCLSPAVLFLENLPTGQSVCLDSLFRRNSCVFGNKKTHDRLPVPLLTLLLCPLASGDGGTLSLGGRTGAYGASLGFQSSPHCRLTQMVLHPVLLFSISRAFHIPSICSIVPRCDQSSCGADCLVADLGGYVEDPRILNYANIH